MGVIVNYVADISEAWSNMESSSHPESDVCNLFRTSIHKIGLHVCRSLVPTITCRDTLKTQTVMTRTMQFTFQGITFFLKIFNYVMKEDGFAINSSSRLDCVLECSMHNKCNSVFYSKDTGHCTLVMTPLSKSTLLNGSQGYEYYTKEKPTSEIDTQRPTTNLLLKTDGGVGLFDLKKNRWSWNTDLFPGNANNLCMDDTDDVYYNAFDKVKIVSLVTGESRLIHTWPYIEAIYAMVVDVKAGFVFHSFLLDNTEIKKVRLPPKAGGGRIYTVGDGAIYSCESMTIDRETRSIHALVGWKRSYNSARKVMYVYSMSYTGKLLNKLKLGHTDANCLEYDQIERRLVYSSPDGLFQIRGSTTRLSRFEHIKSVDGIALSENMVAILVQNTDSTHIAVHSRNGSHLQNLKSPFKRNFSPRKTQIIFTKF